MLLRVSGNTSIGLRAVSRLRRPRGETSALCFAERSARSSESVTRLLIRKAECLCYRRHRQCLDIRRRGLQRLRLDDVSRLRGEHIERFTRRLHILLKHVYLEKRAGTPMLPLQMVPVPPKNGIEEYDGAKVVLDAFPQEPLQVSLVQHDPVVQ